MTASLEHWTRTADDAGPTPATLPALRPAGRNAGGRCRTSRPSTHTPRSEAKRLLALRGVSGEAQYRALATFWTLALFDQDQQHQDAMPVDTDAVGARLGLTGDAVRVAVADLERAGLVERDGGQVRLSPLEGLHEALRNLSRMLTG